MHLADGIVADTAVLLSANLIGVGGLGMALLNARVRCPRYTAWTGTMAAFALAAQAINLPLLPGASAHAMGAGLLTLTLGPARAIVALFAVLAAQALLFADGGLTVLGINTLNIAILPVLTVEVARRLFGESQRGLMAGALLGTLLGSALAGASLAAILIVGAHAPAKLTLLWLVGGQAVVGILEGALTAVAARHLYGAAPRLLRSRSSTFGPEALDQASAEDAAGTGRLLLRTAAVAVCIVIALLPFATSAPDALEVVLRRLELAR